jgi:sulfopyruvate decarboxylase subunit alpha
VSEPQAPGTANADRIVKALVSAGVEIAASLPDSWLSPLIARIEAEPAIRHVRVAREDDGVGICAGASLGGKRAVLICQNAGLLLSANALAGYAHHHQLPFVVLAVYRGSHEDRFYYQMYKGQVTEPVLSALGIPFHIVDRLDDVAIVEAAVREASLARKPVVVLFRREALLGDAKVAS